MDVSNRQYGRTVKYKIKTKWLDVHIEAVRVARETACYVYVGTFGNEYREAKRCELYEYYDTWEDAFSALMNEANRRLTAASAQVRAAEEVVRRVAALRKPEGHETKHCRGR